MPATIKLALPNRSDQPVSDMQAVLIQPLRRHAKEIRTLAKSLVPPAKQELGRSFVRFASRGHETATETIMPVLLWFGLPVLIVGSGFVIYRVVGG
jgi:hypothetical protein